MLKFLLEKEFKQTFRSSFLPKIIFIMPTFLLLVMPWAATQEVKDVRVTIVDNDNSAFTNRLTRKVVASGYFILTSVVRSEKEAMYEIESDKADIMLGYDFGKCGEQYECNAWFVISCRYSKRLCF